MREYKIVRRLDQGGMGQVYEGVVERIDGVLERVAIKIPNESTAELRRLFLNEARVARRLSHEHPHLVTIIDFGEMSDGTLFLVMELIDGMSVSELSDRRPLAWPIIHQVARAMLDALDYLHRNGVVHRDISTRNILLGCDDRIKLIDFGLIKSELASDSGRVCGTPAFASPEQLEGERLSPASDRFSLGSVLYRMATAKRPFGTGSSREILARMAQGAPPLPDDTPDDLARVIRGLLELEPQNRLSSRQALEILTDQGDEADLEIGEEVAARLAMREIPSEPLSVRTLSNAAAPVLRIGSRALPGVRQRESSGPSEVSSNRWWMPWAIGAATFAALLAALVAGFVLGLVTTDREAPMVQDLPSAGHETAAQLSEDPAAAQSSDAVGNAQPPGDVPATSSRSVAASPERAQGLETSASSQSRATKKRRGNRGRGANGWVSTSYRRLDRQ